MLLKYLLLYIKGVVGTMNKKIIMISIVGLFLLSGAVGFSAAGNKIVEKTFSSTLNSNVLYVGGNGPGNYTYIQDALDDASNGDIVYVYSGTYYESVNISVSIALVGENKDTAIIDNLGNWYSVIKIDADDVSISCFTLKNSGASGPPAYNHGGIAVYTSRNCIISDIILSEMEYGIIISQDSDTVSIINNSISQMALAGVYITHNSQNIFVDNNEIDNSWFGICCRKDSSDIFLSENHISLCESIGILVSEIDTVEVSNNHLFENDEGVSIIDSSDSKVTSNIFEGNTIGLGLSNVEKYEVNLNNFLNNERHAFFSSKFSSILRDEHIWDANYWGQSFLPFKIIFGRVGLLEDYVIPPLFYNFFLIDHNPVKDPYAI